MYNSVSYTAPTKKIAALTRNVNPSRDTGSHANPTHQEIAIRAYDIYLKSGQNEGKSIENWLRAERELRSPARAQ